MGADVKRILMAFGLVLIPEAATAERALVFFFRLMDPIWVSFRIQHAIPGNLLQLILGVELLWLLRTAFAHIGDLHLGRH